MASDIKFDHFSVGSMDNNVYIMVDPSSGESVLFDAPCEAERILGALEGTTLRFILMTHADRDHVEALREIKEATGAQIGAHPLEMGRMPVEADFKIEDGQTIRFGNFELQALHTPGHAPGSLSFLLGDILIAGDTLFPGGPGGTTGPHQDFDQIIESIRTKLFVLPDETRVYPGHGTSTTISKERPHLQEWIDRGW